MSAKAALESGQAYPLGSHWDGQGVNFAIFSAHASRVELCLFSDDGKHERARYDLPGLSNQVWHGYLPGAGPGSLYGYRVHGPYQPHLGHRFNAHKLLIDPYAKSLLGSFVWNDSHFGFDNQHPNKDLVFDSRDNQQFMPKCRVVANPEQSTRPRRPIRLERSILYEAHVKGFTMKHPAIPPNERGTFAGLAHSDSLAYLKSLGVTTIELLPIQSFISELFLSKKHLSNYWGYNTLAFFAPHGAYLSQSPEQGGGQEIMEFRAMVDRIHDAGMEIILDVVFNHTAESGRLGPTLSFRGIDNLSYYRLQAEDNRFYVNDTGCGNTLNLTHPRVLQLVMDCLRYWAVTMAVDGFRFDLAPVLGRDDQGFSSQAGFFKALLQDPALAAKKLIAEPWDTGTDGYQLGNFPPGWSEWNDRYRDTVRRFWRGDPGMVSELARRLHGSSDIFEHNGRRPSASINYVCSHDGFTLADLVSYRERHNLANGEDNQDGHRENYSENFGFEGPSSDPEINRLRERQRKNFLLTLFFSQGIPMLLSGDERGHSQGGNNNAYCQDNENSWLQWEALSEANKSLTDFTARLIALRKSFGIFQHNAYIHQPRSDDAPLITWYNSAGEPMEGEHWDEIQLKNLSYLMQWQERDERKHLLVLLNAHRDALTFVLPIIEGVAAWDILVDTSSDADTAPSNTAIQHSLAMAPCSSAVLLAQPRH